MPYAAVERPSLALGTLAAALARVGLASKTIHGNLLFAERIGRAVYEMVNLSEITLQIGEWTFAEAAFGDALPPALEYVDLLAAMGFPRDGLAEWLLAIRAAANRFVAEIAAGIVASRPRIVGCSSVFQQHCASLAVLRRIHELDPVIITMLGGANCEAAMGAATHRNYPWVDYVVSGEADLLLPDLCHHILSRGRAIPTAALPFGVLGPTTRARAPDADATGPNAPRVLVKNLDEIPIPDFDDYFAQLDLSPLRDHILPALSIETSRGCWWGAKHHCTFCGLNGSGMTFRAKLEDRVQQEIRWLSERYRLNKFMTVDNILDHRYFRRVLPALAAQGDKLFFYETKANLSRAQLEVLSDAGVRWIQPGIDALDDGLLKLLDKGCSASVNVQLLKWAYDYGIWVIWNHLYGAPGDDSAWYDRTADWLPLIAHLQPPPTGGMVRIRYDRFSPYFNKAESFGLELKPYRTYGYVYPLDGAALADQVYFFYDDQPAGNAPLRLMGVIREWAAGFYAKGGNGGGLPRRSATAPVLAMRDEDDTTVIVDTRPCAVAALHRLNSLESRICLACDGARSEGGIAETVRVSGGAESEIADALRSLVGRKIIADFGGTFLCLATRAKPKPYLGFEDFAGGLLLTAGRRPAERPADAWNLPVRELFADS